MAGGGGGGFKVMRARLSVDISLIKTCFLLST